MDPVTARKQRVILQEISDSLNRIANFLEETTAAESLERISDVATSEHLKVHVSNEPHPFVGVQSTLKVADLNKPEQHPIHDN